jgi:translation initiation factor 3 subunit M
VEAYESLVRHLAATEEAGEDTAVLAAQAAVEAIRLPQVVQLDGLLGLAAIQQLAVSQPQLFALLKIFAEESLSAYTRFHESNPGFLESVGALNASACCQIVVPPPLYSLVGRAGLTHEECQRKQRVLALAGLASGREEVTYAQVAQELGVEEREVEAWVIEAVGAGVVDARIDQTRRVVLVNHVTLRTFTAEHWQQMSSRLALWRDNLVSLLEVVQQNKKLAA